MTRTPEELDALWETIGSKELCAEFRARMFGGDGECVQVAAEFCPDEPLWNDDEIEDPIFKAHSEWDRDELRKAVREDDGRRAIDVLKRAAA